MRLFIFVILFIGCAFYGHAAVKLPNIISDGMVLQQNSKVKLWGWASPAHKVIIKPSWTARSYTVITDGKGNWDVTVSTAKAGGPFQISLNDGEELLVKDILLGEVWVCAGQSNMVMPLKGYDKGQNVLNSDSIIASSARYSNIRFFDVAKLIAASSGNNCGGDWKVSNPQNAAAFSAIAFQYATRLNDSLHVPIGIIATCWGSTAVQSWMSENTLRLFPEVSTSNRMDTMKVPNKEPENLTAGLFNGMIAPLTRYSIRGFLWYQGESNKNAELYKKLFPAMVKEWRALWGANLPFYYVQIAPWNYKDRNTALLREAQLQANIPNSGMVVSLDAGQQNRIHPPDKTIIALRLSKLALAKTYHLKNIACNSPQVKSAKFKSCEAIIAFNNVYDGLKSKTGRLDNFEIAGPDHIFYKAKAAILATNLVRVFCKQVPKPVAVRYAFTNWVEADLYNSENMPASSFRTDNF